VVDNHLGGTSLPGGGVDAVLAGGEDVFPEPAGGQVRALDGQLVADVAGEPEVPPLPRGEFACPAERRGAVARAVQCEHRDPDVVREALNQAREDDAVESAAVTGWAVVEGRAQDLTGLAGEDEWCERQPRPAGAVESAAGVVREAVATEKAWRFAAPSASATMPPIECPMT
jgi:hypothetical protein